MQTFILGAWIGIRNFRTIVEVCRAWRTSLVVGFFGAAASIAWFIAMTIEPVAHVRTLALVELLFAYFVSRRIFRERLLRTEMLGVALLATGIAIVTLGR
jgi:drug/metabolite transporter (DMT)-like permease